VKIRTLTLNDINHRSKELHSLVYELTGTITTDWKSQLHILKDNYYLYLLNKNYYFFVVEEANKLIGYVEGWIIDDFGIAGKILYIQGIVVLPKYRNKGIGSKLIETVFEYAKQRKVKQIRVESSQKAHSFYEKNGLTDHHTEFSIFLYK